MNDFSKITINVILVRRTVCLLRMFLHSLHARTTGTRFRLVANGCTPAEVLMLREVCEADGRFEVLEISRKKVLRHPVVLRELLRRERTPFFAFMDSDCFVTGDPFTQLQPALEDHGALFSGQPFWHTVEARSLPREYQLLSEAYDRVHGNICVGCSYFAVYKTRPIMECIEETGVSFQEYRWEQLPTSVQAELAGAGLRLLGYDTGKVLNILLGLRGHRCQYLELPHLWHVGAVSASVLSRRRRRIYSALRSALRSSGTWGPLRGFLVRVGLRDDVTLRLGNAERATYTEYTTRRHIVGDHVTARLRGLNPQGVSPARFEHPNEALISAVAVIERHIDQLLQDGFSTSTKPARSTHQASPESLDQA